MAEIDLSTTAIIGITGGIGAGKSVVASVFSEMGVPIFDCDAAARSLYNTDKTLKDFVIKVFGKSLYNTPNGELDRQQLAEILFSDDNALRIVEEQVHSRIVPAFIQWFLDQKSEWCGLESAILYKVKPLLSLCHAVVEVEAPEALRVERVMKRDSTSEEAVQKRIKAQHILPLVMPRQALFRITNDDTSPLLPQVRTILRQLTETTV